MNSIFKGRIAKRSIAPTEGWVLYDSRCGFCSRWVVFLRDTLARHGFAIAPLQSEWVAEELRLLPDELTADVRLLLVNGRQHRGAEVYRYVMRRIWWTRPLYFLSVLPILCRVFDAGYRAFAEKRYCLSEYCGLPGTDEANSLGSAGKNPLDLGRHRR